MKVPLVYPKISENTNCFLDKCIAFEKYDGTNLHWCWNLNNGWHLFGTRRTQFSLNRIGIPEFEEIHPELSNTICLFNDKLRDTLTSLLCQHKSYCNSNITIFTEFYGPNSFAGGHSDNDEDNDRQDLVIIDIAINNKIISPEVLIKDFAAFNVARIVYRGKYTGQFTKDVRDGKYNVDEGVVCKGIVNNEVFMTKVKTNDYLRRLKNR